FSGQQGGFAPFVPKQRILSPLFISSLESQPLHETTGFFNSLLGPTTSAFLACSLHAHFPAKWCYLMQNRYKTAWLQIEERFQVKSLLQSS
ncbi:MAG: hypothetical protein WCC08_00190, partial [Terrimicrobiaceae bacterium]